MQGELEESQQRLDLLCDEREAMMTRFRTPGYRPNPYDKTRYNRLATEIKKHETRVNRLAAQIDLKNNIGDLRASAKDMSEATKEMNAATREFKRYANPQKIAKFQETMQNMEGMMEQMKTLAEHSAVEGSTSEYDELFASSQPMTAVYEPVHTRLPKAL